MSIVDHRVRVASSILLGVSAFAETDLVFVVVNVLAAAAAAYQDRAAD